MPNFQLNTLSTTVRTLFPGFLIAALIALSAQFISEHYGAPAMLMALLFGIALNFLSEEGPCKAGIAFSARTVLRFGVVLLGMRISFEMAAGLGWPIVGLVAAGLISTIIFGMLIARFTGHGPRFAFLSAGSVAICGASAAMAIAAILPQDDRSEERLVFTVVGVTLLSTIAMILYPIFAVMLGFSDQTAGVFIGATVHDVAQVVGAGFSVSQEAGDIATIVKLIRVAMLAPIILVASIIIRRLATSTNETGQRPPIIPGFVAGFIIVVVVNSFGLIPGAVITLSSELSRWALLTAIGAVGLKTSLREVVKVGYPAIILLVAETVFIALFVIGGLKLLAA
ncbi:YeiH family protein [Cochlodiniinecator piscidefendens]|uniref:YeiH family protein n=1 Tax=Cochlodiniinecator piscidefendens TaxID=2715756 RepID=UPI00140CD820|nr:YeiH family protein [Cochlodiniinecator piscidefendens]